MVIKDWIEQQELSGRSTFSNKMLKEAFPNKSMQVIKNNLYRQNRAGNIVSPYRSFYVIVPPHYKLKGVVPPYYYINQLMKFLNKPYYISLYSAAELHGAAHQRPQRYCVTTIPPKIKETKSKSNLINWIYVERIPQKYIDKKNSETSEILFSNPELTALDLVQHERVAGGLSNVSTILIELCEVTDFTKISDDILEYINITTIQRLGYILDVIIDQKEQAEVLYAFLKQRPKAIRFRQLSKMHPPVTTQRDIKWKLFINTEIQPDDI